MNMTVINKETKLYGSFSLNPGNKGTEYFNKAFEKYNVNAIYKSYFIENIEDGVNAARVLNFSGFAVAMPYKKTVVPFLDLLDEEAESIGNVNTVVNKKGLLKGYNTDYLAICKLFTILKYDKIVVVGDGGLASSLTFFLKKNNIEFYSVTRRNWDQLKTFNKETIFNCTPVNIDNFNFSSLIDLNIGYVFGDLLHSFQAKEQFKLYTGIEYDA